VIGQYAANQIPTVAGAGLPSSSAELFTRKGHTISFEQHFSQTRGRHALKYGGLHRTRVSRRSGAEVPIYTFSNLDSILANQPSSAAFKFLNKEYELRQWVMGFFVQDDVRVTPKFMANLGLRWDFSSVPKERDGRFFNRDGMFGPYLDPDSPFQSHFNMFSPRVGFAYSLNNKTVLRAGAGVFFIPFNLTAGPAGQIRNSLTEPRTASLSALQARTLGVRYPASNQSVLPLIQASEIDGSHAIDPNIEQAYSMQWTFGIQRQLSESLVWDVSYVGNGARKLVYVPTVNRADRITGLRANEKFTEFRYYSSADNSSYNSLQTTLKKRFSRSFQFNTAYTWASNLSYFQSNLDCCGEVENPQELDDLRSNHGPTPYMVRHRFTTDFLYQLPAGKGWNRAARHILGGYEVSGVFTASTGTPLLVYQSGSGVGARPDIAPGFTHETAVLEGAAMQRPDGQYQYLLREAFVQIPIISRSGRSARPGNLGRRSIFGPGGWGLDLSLSKSIFVREQHRLQLRVDLFNALNHTTFSGVQTDVRSNKFGQITGVAPGRVARLIVRYEF